MLPLVARATMEVLALVPNHLREASYALGVSKWHTVLSVVLPTAFGGILTGTTLAVARAAGETAPLLFTCSLAGQTVDWNPTHSVNSIPFTIFQYSEAPDENLHAAGVGARVRADRVRARDEPDRPRSARPLAAQARHRAPDRVHHSVTAPVTARQPTATRCRVAAGPVNRPYAPRDKERTSMKRGLSLIAAVLALLATVAGAGAKSTDTTITGAGSTFVSPLVSVWTPALGSAFGYTLQYSAVGSGARHPGDHEPPGRLRRVRRTADARPVQRRARAASRSRGRSPARRSPYNVPGAPVHLNLDGQVIAKIFIGEITNWNDPAIKKLNPGANLPDLKITPIFRSDGSGTTYNFTDYLSAVSPAWKSKVGNSTAVTFPTGIGARGSSGVAGLVSRTRAASRYVDVAFAITNHLKFAAIQNAAGKFLFPSLRRITARRPRSRRCRQQRAAHREPAEVGAARVPDLDLHLRDRPAADVACRRAAEDVFWALTQGQKAKYTAKLLFAPLPKPVLVASEKTLKTVHA